MDLYPLAILANVAANVVVDFTMFDPDRVATWIEWGGYSVLFGLLFACGLGLPLPEDIPLLLGGYFASQGDMNLALVAVVCWLGIIGGDCVLYAIARKYGLNVTRLPIIGRHVTRERILWAEKKFDRYGVWVVAVCRLVAGIRGAMVVAAGTTRFNFVKFVVADGIAALVSGGLFVALGYFLGKKFGTVKEIRERIAPYETWVMAGVIAAVALFILYLWWKHRRRPAADPAAAAAVRPGGADSVTG